MKSIGSIMQHYVIYYTACIVLKEIFDLSLLTSMSNINEIIIFF